VFRGKAQCTACHKLGKRHALFTDEAFHNLGIGFPAVPQREGVEVALAPGVSTRVARAVVQSVSAPVRPDDGRFEVTANERDRSAFRTPTLRNVELTAPYMHDGSLATLRDVVDFYDRGGNPNAHLDALMVPLYLSEQDKQDLVAFMRALTGANVQELARQARAEASTPSMHAD
jgi:cytochrome c peroxidase